MSQTDVNGTLENVLAGMLQKSSDAILQPEILLLGIIPPPSFFCKCIRTCLLLVLQTVPEQCKCLKLFVEEPN